MSTAATTAPDFQKSSVVFVAIFASINLFYFDTASSIVDTWATEAYSHGYIILPISAYLIWMNRSILRHMSVSHSATGFVLLGVLSVTWWVGDLAGVQVMRQFAVLAMLPASVLAVFGRQISRTIRFALLYLFFALPFGLVFVPYLIEITAKITVGSLNLFGIPVFQDGRYFHVPSGSYEVAEACSGLKYLIATFALATLYSYFLFASLSKRFWFVVIAMAVSVFANGVRATTIVLLLHYTELDIAAGPDHEFIGWIVYGILIVVFIFVGDRYRDPVGVEERAGVDLGSGTNRSTEYGFVAVAGPVLAAILLVSIGPVLNLITPDRSTPDTALATGLPLYVEGWQARPERESSWRPEFVGFSRQSYGSYVRDNAQVDTALYYYASQRQGSEITNSVNSVARRDEWRIGDVSRIELNVDADTRIIVDEVVALRAGETRLIWKWYEVNGRPMGGAVHTKLSEIKGMIFGEETISSAVIASTRLSGLEESARTVLHGFVTAFYPQFSVCSSRSIPDTACDFGKSERGLL